MRNKSYPTLVLHCFCVIERENVFVRSTRMYTFTQRNPECLVSKESWKSGKSRSGQGFFRAFPYKAHSRQEDTSKLRRKRPKFINLISADCRRPYMDISVCKWDPNYVWQSRFEVSANDWLSSRILTLESTLPVLCQNHWARKMERARPPTPVSRCGLAVKALGW